MARGPFNRIYPNTGDGIITLDGGLNSRFPVSVIQPNESPDCLNVVFEDGTVSSRQGTTLINTAAVGSFSGDGLFTRHDNSGAETMVGFWNGTAYDLQGTSFIAIASGTSVFTAGTRVGFAEQENYAFFGNGSATPYKWSGTDWTRHGVYPPTTTMTAATSSNGTLTGDVVYKMTYVNSASVESDVGPITATFTATSEAVLISSIPVAPQSFGISSRRIYRATTPAGTFKLVNVINDNSSTTFVDNYDWAELSDNAPTDQGVPPTYSVIENHQDRLWVNDPGNLNYAWYSELGNPYVFKATNFFKVGNNNGALLRGIKPYNNGIVLTHDRGITFIYMPDSSDTNWVRVELNIPFGCRSPHALIAFQDRLLFPAVRNGKIVGIGSLVGTTLEQNVTFLSILNAGGEFISQKIEDKIFDLEEGLEPRFTAIEYKNQIYYAVAITDSATVNDRIFVLNYNIDNLSKVQKFSWSEWSNLYAAAMTVYDGNLYYQDALATGRVFKMNDGTYNDNGAAINAYYWTKEFTGIRGEENFVKDHRFINMLLDQSGAWSMNVNVRVDSDASDGDRYMVDLSPSASLWGTMVWGVDVWGGGVNQFDYKLFLGGLRGKRIQFRFSNQNVADQTFKVHWIKYAYNLKGYR